MFAGFSANVNSETNSLKICVNDAVIIKLSLSFHKLNYVTGYNGLEMECPNYITQIWKKKSVQNYYLRNLVQGSEIMFHIIAI